MRAAFTIGSQTQAKLMESFTHSHSTTPYGIAGGYNTSMNLNAIAVMHGGESQPQHSDSVMRPAKQITLHLHKE